MTIDSSRAVDLDLSGPMAAAAQIQFDPNAMTRNQNLLLSESSLGQWMVTKWLAATDKDAHFVVQSMGRLIESHAGRLLALLPTGRIAGLRRQDAALLRDKILRGQAGWPGLPVSAATALYCADSHPFGLPKQLYSFRDGSPIDWDGFRAVTTGLINTIGVNVTLQGKLSVRANAISTVLFELFKNTHDHARTTAEHGIIGHSVRGLYARYYPRESLRARLPAHSADLIDANLDPAEQYAFSVLQPEPPVGRVLASDGLLELSVFDSGPGLAVRWNGAETKHLPIQDELNFVLACLTKCQSTSSSLTRGFGLWNVLQELRALRGFIRVRTNRVHGYREFNSKRDAALQTDGVHKGTPREVLFDWKRGITTVPSEYANVAGTLISVLLPIGA